MTGVFCMQQMAKNYRDANKVVKTDDYDFFKKVLASYLPFCEEFAENIAVNEEDKKYFDSLIELREISASKEASEWNEEESMADSLAFYISCGLVKRSPSNSYWINVQKLKDKLVEYSNHMENINSITKSKGAIK